MWVSEEEPNIVGVYREWKDLKKKMTICAKVIGMFNNLWRAERGPVAEEWGMAIICPALNMGDRSDCSNY